MRNLLVLGSAVVVAIATIVAGIAMREPELPPVGAARDPVCDQAVLERQPDLVFTRSHAQDSPSATKDVSFGELLSNRRQHVRIVGFLVFLFEHRALYASRDVAERGDNYPVPFTDAVWVTPYDVLPDGALTDDACRYGCHPEQKRPAIARRANVSFKCARIEGQLFVGESGHLSGFRAEIKPTRLEVWSEPYRPPGPEWSERLWPPLPPPPGP